MGYYFPETGHNVIGEFWTFYQSVPDAKTVFGSPISEQFVTSDGSGLTVQYFEKARFELQPGLELGQRVQVTLLGTKLYQPGAPSINQTNPGCRVIKDFGICYDFLTFFDQHGGIARFGNPISAVEFQADGQIVQYFERARFVWHPELAEGQKVQLANLGRIYFNAHEDSSWLNPVLPFNNDIPVSPVHPTSLRLMAFTSSAVSQPTDTQKIFIIVQDQVLKPVVGASGNVTVHLTDGQSLVYPVTTDASGLGIVASLSFTNQNPGSLVTVDVQMNYLGLTAKTTTSFRIWH